MAGTEDLGLRRLFRPPLDTLSVEEQVDYYRKRNLVQSKLHRTASSSFEVPLIRRRVIDASTFEHRTEGEIQITFTVNPIPQNLDLYCFTRIGTVLKNESCVKVFLLRLPTIRLPYNIPSTYIQNCHFLPSMCRS